MTDEEREKLIDDFKRYSEAHPQAYYQWINFSTKIMATVLAVVVSLGNCKISLIFLFFSIIFGGISSYGRVVLFQKLKIQKLGLILEKKQSKTAECIRPNNFYYYCFWGHIFCSFLGLLILITEKLLNL